MVTEDPAWDENERRAFKADWQAWVDFAGGANTLPADYETVVRFIEEELESGRDAIAGRRKMVIQRIHVLNDLPDPFGIALQDDDVIWKLLANDGFDEGPGFVARTLTHEQWATIRQGRSWPSRKSLKLNGIEVPEVDRWYQLMIDNPPPLSSLQLGDDHYPSWSLGDPSAAIGAVSSSLTYFLRICGTFSLTEPVELRLKMLFLKGYGAVRDDWFSKSDITTTDAFLGIEGIDATQYLSIVMNPALASLELDGAKNVCGLLAELFTRPDPPYLDVQTLYDEASEDPGPAFEALMNASDAWKRQEITVPTYLFEADMIDELDEAGFKIIEN